MIAVLEGRQISLVAVYQKAKRKGVHIKNWCKQTSVIFTTIEISSNDFITKLLQNISMLYLSQLFKVILLSDVVMSLCAFRLSNLCLL